MAKTMGIEDRVAVLFGEAQANPTDEDLQTRYAQCRDLLLDLTGKDSADIPAFEKELAERLKGAKEKAEKAAKAEKTKAENAAKAALSAKVEAADSLDSARVLLSEVSAFGERYVITLTSEGFSTNLKPRKRGGATGSGRPGKDTPSGYAVASTGEAIMGGFNTWVKEQLKADAFSAEVTASLHGPISGKLKAKAKTAPILVENGYVIVAEATDSEAEVSETVETEVA